MLIVGRCIVYTGIRLLLFCPFISSFFFLSNFQTLKFFVTLFSRTVRPRRLKNRYTHRQWADVSCVPESGCCCLLVPLFLHFLSLQFSNIKIFRTLLSGTVRTRRLKLGTHVNSGWMYGVYQNQAAAAHSFLYFLFLQYPNIEVFVTLFSGTVRPRQLKLGAHMDSGWMYRVYQNQAAAAAYLFLFLHLFSLQFSNIKMFLSHLSQKL